MRPSSALRALMASIPLGELLYAIAGVIEPKDPAGPYAYQADADRIRLCIADLKCAGETFADDAPAEPTPDDADDVQRAAEAHWRRIASAPRAAPALEVLRLAARLTFAVSKLDGTKGINAVNPAARDLVIAMQAAGLGPVLDEAWGSQTPLSPAAQAALDAGIASAKTGPLVDLGSFARFLPVEVGQRRVHVDLGAYAVEETDEDSTWIRLDHALRNPRRLWDTAMVAKDPIEVPAEVNVEAGQRRINHDPNDASHHGRAYAVQRTGKAPDLYETAPERAWVLFDGETEERRFLLSDVARDPLEAKAAAAQPRPRVPPVDEGQTREAPDGRRIDIGLPRRGQSSRLPGWKVRLWDGGQDTWLPNDYIVAEFPIVLSTMPSPKREKPRAEPEARPGGAEFQHIAAAVGAQPLDSTAEEREAVERIKAAVPHGYDRSPTDLITDLGPAIARELRDRSARASIEALADYEKAIGNALDKTIGPRPGESLFDRIILLAMQRTDFESDLTHERRAIRGVVEQALGTVEGTTVEVVELLAKYRGFAMNELAETRGVMNQAIGVHVGETLPEAVNRLAADRDAYKADLREELDGIASLRREHGAKDGEMFPAFVGRLAEESMALTRIRQAFAAPGVPEAPLPDPEEVIAGLRALVEANDLETVEQAVHRAFDVVRSKLRGAIEDIADLKRHVESLATESGELLDRRQEEREASAPKMPEGYAERRAVGEGGHGMGTWDTPDGMPPVGAFDKVLDAIRRAPVRAPTEKERALLAEFDAQPHKWIAGEVVSAEVAALCAEARHRGIDPKRTVGEVREILRGEDGELVFHVPLAGAAYCLAQKYREQCPAPTGPRPLFVPVDGWAVPARSAHLAEEKALRHLLAEAGRFVEACDRTGNGEHAPGWLRYAVRAAQDASLRRAHAEVDSGVIVHAESPARNAVRRVLAMGAAHLVDIEQAVSETGERDLANVTRRELRALGAVRGADGLWRLPNPKADPSAQRMAAAWAKLSPSDRSQIVFMTENHAVLSPVLVPAGPTAKALAERWAVLTDNQRGNVFALARLHADGWENTILVGDMAERMEKAWANLTPAQREGFVAKAENPAWAWTWPALSPSESAKRLSARWESLTADQRADLALHADLLTRGRTVELLTPGGKVAERLCEDWGMMPEEHRLLVADLALELVAYGEPSSIIHVTRPDPIDLALLLLGAKLRFKGTTRRADFSVVTEHGSVASGLLNLVATLRDLRAMKDPTR